jgi:ABC-type amino acid transport substrate-binding protein
MRIWIVALLGLLAAWSARAADERSFVIGVEAIDYYPNYAIRDGQYVGAARQIFDAFAADENIKFSYRPLPVRRLYADLLAGAIDFKYPDNPGWAPGEKQGADVAYSGPVVRYVDGVLVLPANKAKDVAAIKTLGTVSGFTPFAWLDRVQANQVKLAENPQFGALLRQALTGRIDGAYANVAVATYQLEVMGSPGGLVFDPGLPNSRESYRLSATRHRDVIAAFDRWLTAQHARVEAIKAQLGAERGID